jgi:hypothetical protein
MRSMVSSGQGRRPLPVLGQIGSMRPNMLGHGSRAFMRAKHISLRILRRLPLNSLSTKVIHIEPYPLMLIGTDDFTSGTCSILL